MDIQQILTPINKVTLCSNQLIMQLHNDLFIYKPFINEPRSFNSSCFTKAYKQQQYSLREIRKALLT